MPGRKIGASAMAGSATVIMVWAVKQFGGLDIPGEVASAITVFFSFAAGYFIPEP